MRALPAPDPGVPDLRSPARFLLRVLRLQAGTMALGSTFGSLAFCAAALVPYALGRAVDDGLRAGDTRGLLLWCGALLGLAVGQAVSGTLRHRTAILSFLRAEFRTLQWLARQVARLGTELPRQVSTGEVGLVLADPHTRVLDEATSLLDRTAARSLERSLGRVLEGRTVVAVAHRLHTAHDADRVAVVDEGRVAEPGTHDELLAAGGSYAALWHARQADAAPAR